MILCWMISKVNQNCKIRMIVLDDREITGLRGERELDVFI